MTTPPRNLADVALGRRCPVCRAPQLADCRNLPAGVIHGARLLRKPRLTDRGRVVLWMVALTLAAGLGMYAPLWDSLPWAVTP